MSELEKKIQDAIRILKIAEQQASVYDEPVEVAYSGGKDSDIILQLAKESNINFKAYYKQTTIDPPGTLNHVRENNVEIIRPKITFFQLIEKKGFPSFQHRFCCEALKEYKILNTAIWGIRASESVKRKKRYTTFDFCRKYNSKDKVHIYLPILSWNLIDVKNFISDRNLKLAPIYYNNDGSINYKARLGCLACPLKSDIGKADFLKYKSILISYLKAGQKYFLKHYDKNDLRFKNIYELFLFRTFFRKKSKYELAMTENNLFNSKINAKEFLENYFHTKLDL
jgi:phosphoadenosine phosphosulfate reductase